MARPRPVRQNHRSARKQLTDGRRPLRPARTGLESVHWGLGGSPERSRRRRLRYELRPEDDRPTLKVSSVPQGDLSGRDVMATRQREIDCRSTSRRFRMTTHMNVPYSVISMPRKRCTFLVEADQPAALKRIKTRDGVPQSEQVRRAIAEWIASRWRSTVRRNRTARAVQAHRSQSMRTACHS